MAQKFHSYGPDNVGTLLTTTQSHYVDNMLIDNFFNQTPLLRKLKANAKMVNGGASIITQLMHDQNSTATWYNGLNNNIEPTWTLA